MTPEVIILLKSKFVIKGFYTLKHPQIANQKRNIKKVNYLQKAIVTGANGFVGSWLCKELSDHGVKVAAIVRNEESDISKIKALPNTKNCYYIGSGNTKQLREYLILIKEIYGKGSEISLGNRAEDNLFYNKEWFNTNDLIEDVGFTCEYSFEAGIQKTIRWIKENIDYVI